MKNLYIGLMSGTSMDGIDAALIDAYTNQLIAGITRPYSPKVKSLLSEILILQNQSLQHYSQLNTLIGREFADAVHELLQKAQVKAAEISAIGSHGQTLLHDAKADIPYTIQIGCPHTIAELTQITVVADFRTRDLIVGGQGAPFAPIYHQELFKEGPFPLAMVNIGGIANLSYLMKNQVSGYDLGPGNCLMDAWIHKHLGKSYDDNGNWAATGQVIEPLLQTMLADPYFQLQTPKSIGKEYFSLVWLEHFLQDNYKPEDIQATLLQLSAESIIHGIRQESLAPKKVLLCGGGAHNSLLIKAMQALLPEISIISTKKHQINPDFIEAMMFAWLADKTLAGTALDLREITGAKKTSILGAIYPANRS